MKKRNFDDIAFVNNPDGGLAFNHLIGEMEVPCNGGAYLLAAECGVGKSTGITSLVKLFADEGFILFEKTKAECDEARRRLLRAGVMPSEIMTLHADSPDYYNLYHDINKVVCCRVLIIPSIHFFSDFLPVLLAYDGGRKVDIEPYVGNVAKLMKSDKVRRFVICDESIDHIQPFTQFSGLELSNIFSHYSTMCGVDGVAVDLSDGGFINPMPLDQMERLYFSRVSKTSSAFFKGSGTHTALKAREALAYLRRNFSWIALKSSVNIYHNLCDLVQSDSKCNIYLFDATGAVLSNYKRSGFKLIESNCKSYSSPITFERFVMLVDRWKSEEQSDATTIASEVKLMADEVERQIDSIEGSLLVITWKYMSLRYQDPEKSSEQIDVISELDQELKRRSLDGRYSIIYRGSGDDRATNIFSDYEAICFLGEWRCGTANVKNVNRNLGINSTELHHRVAAMVQAICRIRIRQHEGKSIKVFYSSDIDTQLMAAVFTHFVENSEEGVSVTGVPVFVPDNRTITNIEKLKRLCDYDSSLFSHIKRATPYTLSIDFQDIIKLIPMRERRRRSYAPLAKWLMSEYKIKLNLL